jgi:Protein of unknown function (DUF1552)
VARGLQNGTSMTISRRNLLKYLGVSALAAPALMSMRGRRAEAAGGARPRRLLILFTPHGAPAEYFWPKSATDLTSMAGDISILAPLQKHAAKLNIVRGINYVGSDNHYANKDVITAKGPDSLDTLVAQKLGCKPLRLGVVPDYANSFTVDGFFTMEGGKAVQGQPDPASALAAITGDLPAGGGGGAPPASTGPTASDLRHEALGVTSAELAELRTHAGGAGLQDRLDKHAAAVGALAGAGGGGGGQPPQPVAGCVKSPALAAVDKVRGKNIWAQENFSDVMDAQAEVAAFALRCGLTRVVTIQAGYVNYGVPFTWIGINSGHHGLSHGVRDQHAKCQQWFALKLAGILDALDVPDPEDPAHTMLDNTTVMWCSEIADGQQHNCQSVPMVIAGGGGGYLKTGQYLQLDNVSHATLLCALAESMGTSGLTFGGPGPLTEVKA